jgi:hypothetical protein
MMMNMSARAALSALACCAALLAAVLVLGAHTVHAAPAPAAHAAATCDVKKDGRRLGATYVTALTATKVSCAKAKRLVKAFNTCRHAHGGVKGKCTSFSGYRCTEKRQSIPTELEAKASCRASGGRALKIAYTEFT